jgi:hypothetical protein
MTTTAEEAKEALATLGVEYKAALEQADRIRDLLKAAVLQADGLGVSRLESIRLSQLSRTAAYRLFNEVQATQRTKA